MWYGFGSKYDRRTLISDEQKFKHDAVPPLGPPAAVLAVCLYSGGARPHVAVEGLAWDAV